MPVRMCQRDRHQRNRHSRHHQALKTDRGGVSPRWDSRPWVYPGHGDDTTLGGEPPSLQEWRERTSCARPSRGRPPPAGDARPAGLLREGGRRATVEHVCDSGHLVRRAPPGSTGRSAALSRVAERDPGGVRGAGACTGARGRPALAGAHPPTGTPGPDGAHGFCRTPGLASIAGPPVCRGPGPPIPGDP
jgi:hypothetical protein